MNKWMHNLLGNDRRVAIPILTHTGIEMIGKHVKDAVTSGVVHYEAIKVLSEKYPAAASTVIMDLTVEAEAFGATVNFPEDEVPTVIGRLVSDRPSVEALQVPELSKGRLPQYLLANKLAVMHLDKPVFSGCIGPFSLAGRLFDLSAIMMEMYIDPETVHLLLQKCTSFLLSYCQALKQLGAQGVMMAEPAAGLLSNSDCKAFSSVYVKQLIEAVQDDDFLVILHNCGNTGHCTEATLFTGAAGYHFGNKMDMKEALNSCPKDVLVMGNLDPVAVFKASLADEVYQATTDLLQRTASYPNYILSSGCDIPPHVPLKNMDAFYQALADYNTNR